MTSHESTYIYYLELSEVKYFREKAIKFNSSFFRNIQNWQVAIVVSLFRLYSFFKVQQLFYIIVNYFVPFSMKISTW